MTRFYRIMYYIIWPFLWLLYPHRVVGLERLPEGGALLCPNHACWIDPVLVALSLPARSRLYIMAKEELMRIPVLGFLLKKLGAVIPVRRGEKDLGAMKAALRSLGDGNRLLIFPEGTRVDEQGDVEGKGGVVMMATRTGLPLVPVYCGGKKKFLRRTTVVIGEPYVPKLAGRRATAEENHRIAGELMERIYALSEVNGWK